MWGIYVRVIIWQLNGLHLIMYFQLIFHKHLHSILLSDQFIFKWPIHGETQKLGLAPKSTFFPLKFSQFPFSDLLCSIFIHTTYNNYMVTKKLLHVWNSWIYIPKWPLDRNLVESITWSLYHYVMVTLMALFSMYLSTWYIIMKIYT